MSKPRWPLALALAATATLGTARAASVRDQAKLFSPDAVQKAETELTRIEREHQIPVMIETIPSLNGEDIADVSLERAKRAESKGMYILIAKQEHKIYDRVSRSYSNAIDSSRQETIREAFQTEFKKGDFDAGLLQGVKTIGTEVAAARAAQPRRAVAPAQGRPGVPVRPAAPGGFGLGSLLGIGLLIVGVLFLFRLIGSLFRGGSGYAPGPMGRPGYGPGYGGGGGGGFMSSLFGGIGGAMAGNWLYDQFSGRHHGGMSDSSTYGGDAGAAPQGDEWGGGTGGGSDWGGGGGGDTGGGGDWGGGGGGGDWGGGGGGDAGGGDW